MDRGERTLMLRRRIAVRLTMLCAMAMAALGAASATRAAIPDANGVFHACYAKSGATMRIIDSATMACGSNETAIQWSQTGPTGAPGSQGSPGNTGLRGPSGGLVGDNYSSGFNSVLISTDPSAPTPVVSLTLPAGSYLLNAAVGLYSNVTVGTLVPFTNVQCAFSDATGTIDTDFRVSVGGSATSYATLPMVAAITLVNADTVVLGCVTGSGPGVLTRPSVVTAIQVETLVTP